MIVSNQLYISDNDYLQLDRENRDISLQRSLIHFYLDPDTVLFYKVSFIYQYYHSYNKTSDTCYQVSH